MQSVPLAINETVQLRVFIVIDIVIVIDIIKHKRQETAQKNKSRVVRIFSSSGECRMQLLHANVNANVNTRDQRPEWRKMYMHTTTTGRPASKKEIQKTEDSHVGIRHIDTYQVVGKIMALKTGDLI
jgi:hypothetical protein